MHTCAGLHANPLMRSIAAAALVVLVGSTAHSQALIEQPQQGRTWEYRRPPNAAPPALEVAPQTIELGDIIPETKHQASVRLTNTGDETIQIRDARSTCWCTVATLEKTLLEPGESMTLNAEVEAPDMLGELGRVIFVFIEGYSQPVSINVNGYVSRGVRAELKFTPPDQTRTGQVTLQSTSGRPFAVVTAGGAAPIHLDGFDPASNAVRSSYVIRYDLGDGPDEDLPKWFFIETDHATAAIIDLPVTNVTAELNRRPTRWTFEKERIILGSIEQGECRDFTILLRGVRISPLDAIQSLSVESDGVGAQLLGIESDEQGLRMRFRMSYEQSPLGLTVALLTLEISGEKQTLAVIGRVVGASPGRTPS